MNMRKLPEDFSKFGKHFQESMVQLMLEDRAYCDQITEVLDPNFFELAYLQVFVNKILDYRKKFLVMMLMKQQWFKGKILLRLRRVFSFQLWKKLKMTLN